VGVAAGAGACAGDASDDAGEAGVAMVDDGRALSTALTPPTFTFIELFAGVGGFRIGLEAVGGKCLYASEIDPEACDTYTLNFGNEHLFGDV
jgi:hypothetical protein